MAPLIDDVIQFLVYLWIVLAVGGIPFGIFVMHDAQKDVLAREEANINSGREALARLLVTTSKLYVFSLTVFLLVGLYVLSPLSRIPGWWRGLPVPLGLNLGLGALTYMMFYKHRVRKGVYTHDMRAEQSRLLAAAALVSSDMQGNTAAQHDLAEAIRESTKATERMTHEMGNGPLAASLQSTIAIDRLSAAMDINTSLHTSEVEANTVGLEANTVATELNTEARIGNGDGL